MYRWDETGMTWGRRFVLRDPDWPDAHWGVVDGLVNGDWFVVSPDVPEPFHATLAGAKRAVEAARGIDPSEVA